MKPSIQGLLGPDKLKAVLVPGMKDDIYSLCQLLQPNPICSIHRKWCNHYDVSRTLKRQSGKETRLTQQIRLVVYIFYVNSRLLLHHFLQLFQLHSRILQCKGPSSMTCIRGIHSMVSIDCRTISNPRIIHVIKLYTATVCSAKTKTAAQRLCVHIHATTLLVITSQQTSLCHLVLAFVLRSHFGPTNSITPYMQ